MNKVLLMLGIFITLFSCENPRRNHVSESAIDVSSSIGEKMTLRDTAITYNIEGISLEGAEAKARYSKNKIESIDVMIFGETGQAIVEYLFSDKTIAVRERVYRYKKILTEVKSPDDMELESEVAYTIDYSGNFIGDSSGDPINVFKEIKEVVPFELVE